MSNILLLLIKTYIPIQLILSPLVIMNRFYRKKYDNFNTLWIMHRALLIMVITIPLLVLIKPVDMFKQKQPNDVVSKSAVIISNSDINDEYIIKDSPIIPYVLAPSVVPSPTEKNLFSFNWIFISFILLSVGLLNTLLSLFRERVIINRIQKDSKYLQVENVAIYISPTILSSFSFGIFQPKIFLNDKLDSTNRNIIVTHELNHIKSGHLIWLNIEVICKKLFWFNPLFYILSKEGEILRELLCDIKSIKQVDVREYGKALVYAAVNNIPSPKISCVGWDTNSGLKLRIEKLLSTKTKIPSKFSRLFMISITTTIFAVLMSFPVNVFAEDNTINMVGKLNTVPESLFKEFLKESEKHGAFLASQNFNMKDVIMSLPEKERDNIPWASPLQFYRRTLSYGMQRDPFTGKDFFHRGNDLAYARNHPIYSPGYGEVIFVDYQPEGYGNVMVIKHSYEFYTIYGHLEKVIVKVGDNVKTGDLIAKMGSTGRSTGPHLHYEIRQGRRPNLSLNTTTEKTFKRSFENQMPDWMFSSLNSFDFISKEEVLDNKNYEIFVHGNKYGINRLKEE